jgi:hypothetical protein
MNLSKPNRTAPFDVHKHMREESCITQGFIHAISTGNWNLKRCVLWLFALFAKELTRAFMSRF